MTSTSSGNQIFQLCLNPAGSSSASPVVPVGSVNVNAPTTTAALMPSATGSFSLATQSTTIASGSSSTNPGLSGRVGTAPQRLSISNGLISSMTAVSGANVLSADPTPLTLGSKLLPPGGKIINNVPQSPINNMNALLQATNIYNIVQQQSISNGQLASSNNLMPVITGTPSSSGTGSITTGNSKGTSSTTIVALPPASHLSVGTTKIGAPSHQQPPRILTPNAHSNAAPKSSIITLVPANPAVGGLNGPNATTPTTTFTISAPSSPALVSSILKGGVTASVNSNQKAANLVSSIINNGSNSTQPIVTTQTGSQFLSHNLQILPGLHPIHTQTHTIAQLSSANGILNQLQLKPASSASLTNAASASSSSNTRLISNMVGPSPSTSNIILTSFGTSNASQSQSATVNLISNNPANSTGQPPLASSPLKPNIIRKYNNNRKDSPASSNSLSAMLNASNEQSYPNLRHPIYEITQEAIRQSAASNLSGTINTAIPLSTLSHLPSTLSTSSQASSSSAQNEIHNSLLSSNNISQLIKSGIGSSKFSNTTIGPSVQLVHSNASGQSVLLDPNSLNQPNNQPSAIILPTTSAQPTSSSTILAEQNHYSPVSSSSSNDTSRKRRKQDLKTQQQMIDNDISSIGGNKFASSKWNETIQPLNQHHHLNINNSGQSACKIPRLEPSTLVKKLKNDSEEYPVQIYSDNEDEYENAQELFEEAETKSQYLREARTVEEEEDIEMIDDGSGYYMDDETLEKLSKEFDYVTEQGLKWRTRKRKLNIAMGDFYANPKQNWSVKSNHYERYSDLKEASIKYKEYNTTLLAAATCNLYQREMSSMFSSKISVKDLESCLNEWKFHYVISGIKNIACCETESLNEINQLFEFVQDNRMKFSVEWIVKINDAIKSNSQRHMYINEQLDESQQLLKRLFENKNSYIHSLTSSSPSNKSSKNNGEGSEAFLGGLASPGSNYKDRLNSGKSSVKKKLIKSSGSTVSTSTVLSCNIGRNTHNSATTAYTSAKV